jgi:hypothetical protein
VIDFLAPFDATAGKMPAWPIAMPDEQNAGRFVDDDALDTQRDEVGARYAWDEPERQG